VLPDNIHEVVQGRLHVSLTKVYDGTNILVNQFASKEEVIQVHTDLHLYVD
jgi:patatin-like phospholipase domain-containing protein 3